MIGVPIMKSQPVADKSSGNVGDRQRPIGMLALMVGQHRPNVVHANALELAMPLPGMLAAGPSIFER